MQAKAVNCNKEIPQFKLTYAVRVMTEIELFRIIIVQSLNFLVAAHLLSELSNRLASSRRFLISYEELFVADFSLSKK